MTTTFCFASYLCRFMAVMAAFILCASSKLAHAGEMINVGDHKLEIVRSGQGSPTVVFEGGISASLEQWKGISPMLGTSTVAYMRAGHGRSETAKGPRTPQVIVSELHTLLERAGCKPPYVLVGNSLGGLYIRIYAVTYPSEVAGLVLVDGTPDRWAFEERKLSHPGLWPPAGLETLNSAQKAEWDGFTPIVESGEIGVTGKLPDVPMAILTGIRPNAMPTQDMINLKRALHSEEFQSTTYGMHIVTSRSGHNILDDEPHLVVGAIRWVIDAVRTKK